MLTRIDFDTLFREHLTAWFQSAGGEEPDYDRMEEEMPAEYLRWLSEPNPALGGVSPEDYFPKSLTNLELFELAQGYMLDGMPLPDPLMTRITEKADPEIAYMLMDEPDEELQILAINLLIEMGGTHPYDKYILWIANDEGESEVAQAAAEQLCFADEPTRLRLIEVLRYSDNPVAIDTLFDILTHFPSDDFVMDRLLDAFRENADKRALYASFMARYGDERALPLLEESLSWMDINYLDYLEIRNAVEALGGEPKHDRSFEGDSYFESLKLTD